MILHKHARSNSDRRALCGTYTANAPDWQMYPKPGKPVTCFQCKKLLKQREAALKT